MGRMKNGGSKEGLDFSLQEVVSKPLTEFQIRQNEAETEFLELNEQGVLTTEADLQEQQAQRERRERVAAAQPPENLQAAEAVQEAAPIQRQQQAQACSWKDRYVRKVGAQQLREMANAQRGGPALQVRSRAQREQEPMTVNQKAHRLAAEEGRMRREMERRQEWMRQHELDKQAQKRAFADEQMERGSKILLERMRNDFKSRKGEPSGPDKLEMLSIRTSTLTTFKKVDVDVDYIWTVLNTINLEIRPEGMEWNDYMLERNKYLSEKDKLHHDAQELSGLYWQMLFRREYVLPKFQERGVRRPDLVDSVDRLEQSINQAVAQLDARVDSYLAKAKKYILDWIDGHPGEMPLERIREFFPDYTPPQAQTETTARQERQDNGGSSDEKN